jgi:large subunit ribosomal protein L29
MKQKEITSMSVQDLKDSITNSKESLTKMKLAHKVSPMENPLEIRTVRRTIARLKTELSKREAQA